MDKVNLAWNVFFELRKELVESQKIRAQVIGFKITFVSAAIGLIGTNLDKIPNMLLVIPAFAAIFFDFLINSYSFSIKRMGFYFRNYLEPLLKNNYQLPEGFLLWEEFLKSLKTDQSLSFMGHLGITLLAIGVAAIALFLPFRLVLSSIVLVILAIFLALDIWSFKLPKRFQGDKLETRGENEKTENHT